jgi:hypothetical protein
MLIAAVHEAAVSKDDGPDRSSFEARPAVQVHRKARTSSDNGEAVAQGMTTLR